MDRQVVGSSSWREWKTHPVTQLFLAELLSHAETYVSALATGAGVDPVADRYKVGLIAGIGLAADWRPQLVEDSNEL